jgi:hypothetical protein
MMNREIQATDLRHKKLLDVFSGIESAYSSKSAKETSSNPEGIESSSPGLARFREGQPWGIAGPRDNPEMG